MTGGVVHWLMKIPGAAAAGSGRRAGPPRRACRRSRPSLFAAVCASAPPRGRGIRTSWAGTELVARRLSHAQLGRWTCSHDRSGFWEDILPHYPAVVRAVCSSAGWGIGPSRQIQRAYDRARASLRWEAAKYRPLFGGPAPLRPSGAVLFPPPRRRRSRFLRPAWLSLAY